MTYELLTKMLQACLLFAAKKNEPRAQLRGVHVKQEDGLLTVEASDGATAIRFHADGVANVLRSDIDVILNADDVKVLLSALKSLGTHFEEVNLARTETAVVFDAWPVRVVNMHYPDLSRVLWDSATPEPVDEIGLDAELVTRWFKVVKLFRPKQHKGVKLQFKSASHPVRATFGTRLDGVECEMWVVPCRL